MSEDHVYEGGSKVSVSIWTTARSGPQWKARVTDEADEELIDRTVGRAVRAYNAVERELAALRPFAGSEPQP